MGEIISAKAMAEGINRRSPGGLWMVGSDFNRLCRAPDVCPEMEELGKGWPREDLGQR